MKKRKPVKFFLFSFLIHLGILSGMNVLFIPAPVIPEQSPVIPVQTVFIEEEKEEGIFPTGPTLTETELSKDVLVAKAEIAMGTPGPSQLEDFPGPIPKEGSFEPSLDVEKAPAPGVLPAGERGKQTESRQVVSSSVSPPLQLPVVPPTVSPQSPLPEVEEPKIPTEAEAGGTPIYSMTLEKTSAPLGRNRPHPEFIADLTPIPTVRSPVLTERREMTLAQPGALEVETSMSAPSISLEQSEESGKSLGERPKIKPFSNEIATLQPLIGEVEQQGATIKAEEGFSVLLVLDTSGSVKGEPLEGIKRSAIEVVSLLGEMDRCGVMTFNDEVSLVVSFTSNTHRVKGEIRRLQVKGRNTVLFDALDQAVILLRKEEDKKRFVLVFSDGKDEGSQSTLDKVINGARSAQISIFSVGYSQVEKGYLTNLENISSKTGGIFSEAPHFREIVELFRTARSSKKKKQV